MGTHEKQDLRDRATACRAGTWSYRRRCAKAEAAAWPCAHLGCPRGPSMREQRPHLCHLDHVGELSEAGDGDDVMVRPALGPGKKKSMVRG